MKHDKNFNLEICVDSLESALIAQEAGADRVELCSDLLEGGITPSYGLIKAVRKNLNIDLAVMIRPRGGDFCYSDEDYSVMKEDILMAKELKANCLVFGLLNPQGNIDMQRTSELVQLARPLQVTFHRAFDLTKNPFRALEDLIALRIDRLLTSGQESTAILGKDLLKKLVLQAKQRISIMAGAGVNPNNKDILLNDCQVDELHLTAKKLLASKMIFKTEIESFIGEQGINTYKRYFADKNIIKKMLID